MEKYIYDASNGLWYELQGNYYIPCLSLSKEEEQPIGLWGQRHLRYIREYRKALYTITQQMAQVQGINEALKVADQMAWVGRMNNIRACAAEIVDTEIIYA